MAYVAEIVLPSGTRTVEVSDIPALFADAIQPKSSSNARVVSDLKKQLLDQAGVPRPGLHPLTSDPLNDYNTPEQRVLEAAYVDEHGGQTSSMSDWALLSLAWTGLPTFRFPLPETEWPAYQAALRKAAPMFEGWVPVPEWDSDNGHATILNLHAQVAHRNQLRTAIKTGALAPLSPVTLLPVSPTIDTQLDNCFVTVDELREYAARFHIDVQVAGLERQNNADVNDDEDDGDKHEPFTPLFEAYFDLPLVAIPPKLVAQAKRVNFLETLWDELSPARRRDLISGWDYRHDPANERLLDRTWWDQQIDAAVLFRRTALTPDEAAALLCRHSPLKMQPGDPETISNDKTNPDDYKRLLRVFEDFQHTQPQHRSLAQWLSIAQAERLTYHSWIDEWLQGEPEDSRPGIHSYDIDAQVVALPILQMATPGEAAVIESAVGTAATASVPNVDHLELPQNSAKTEHRLRNRIHMLNSVDEMAIAASADKNCHHAVWAAYVKIAQDSNRPAPLLGYVEDEGVKYTKDTGEGGIAFDNRRAFTARFRRRVEKRRQHRGPV